MTPPPSPEQPVTDAVRQAEPERWKDWCLVAEPGETVPITPDALLLIILCLEQALADSARYQKRIGAVKREGVELAYAYMKMGREDEVKKYLDDTRALLEVPDAK